MRKLIFVLLLALPGFATAANLCARVQLTKPENHNVQIAIEKYPFENSRGLGDYVYFLGKSFAAKISSILKSETLFDSGAGLGRAAFEIAEEKGARTIAVNGQDGLSFLKQALERISLDSTASSVKVHHERTGDSSFPDVYYVESVAGVPRAVLAELGNSMGFELLRSLEKPRTVKSVDAHAVAEQAHEILQAYLERVGETANFEYKIGLVENALKENRGLLSVITDVFGAFFYSPGRVGLLQEMHASLKPGGRAFLSLMGFVQMGISDQVLLRDGRRIPLFDYLLTKYPEVFRIEGSRDPAKASSEPPVLIMTKSKGDLRLRLQVESALPDYDEGGMKVPRILYREI